MAKCLSLARLPKPPLYTHVHFVRHHPGSPEKLFQNIIGPGVLDPSHPGIRTPVTAYPQTSNKYFSIKAFPNALLMQNPDTAGFPSPQIDSWADRIGRATASRELTLEQTSINEFDQSPSTPRFQDFVSEPILLPHPKGSIPMDLYFSTGKARTHKHAVIRRRLRTKFKGAINLVVTRGARAKEASSDVNALDFDNDEVRLRGDKWILPNWTYMCYPKSELYLVPYSVLIQLVRKSLQRIWSTGMRLEKLWAERETLHVHMVNDLYNQDKRPPSGPLFN